MFAYVGVTHIHSLCVYVCMRAGICESHTHTHTLSLSLGVCMCVHIKAGVRVCVSRTLSVCVYVW